MALQSLRKRRHWHCSPRASVPHIQRDEAPPPPLATWDPYPWKSRQGTGISSSIDSLTKDFGTVFRLPQDAASTAAKVKAREDELKVMAEATRIMQKTSSGAVSQTSSLLQLRAGKRMQTRRGLVKSDVIVLVKRLAHECQFAALAQLASRVAAVAKYGVRNGEHLFLKVKGLIQNTIGQL